MVRMGSPVRFWRWLDTPSDQLTTVNHCFAGRSAVVQPMKSTSLCHDASRSDYAGSSNPLMGPSGGEGQGGTGLRSFGLVRRSRGRVTRDLQRVTLPRYATLESARSIQRPSMGLLRRPTPGEIVRADDQPALRAGRAIARIPKTRLRLRRQSHIQLPDQHIPHGWRWCCPDAHRANVTASATGTDSLSMRSDASCMASTLRVVPADQLRVLQSSREPS
jgi:hypothetical protein